MLFDSPAYCIFLIVVVVIYWRLQRRQQNILLLAASYFFYGWWDWRFLALMIGSTGMDFLIAQRIAPGLPESSSKKWLVASVLLNISVLGAFKYFDFFVDSFSAAMHSFGLHDVPVPLLRILLPPGISFYTFQEVAYIIDVYKGKIPAAKSFVEYGLFVSFFPHLIAGPIQQPGHLLPQVQGQRSFHADRFFDGLMLILSGLLRKCVIADNCALLANAAFSGQFGPSNICVVLIGTYAFAWQVYGDFSGYSDIARGSAQLMGFHFMVNFRQPFLAHRLQDLWRRWHISLSTWLRDYLYVPLGGSSESGWKTSRNLFTTMVLAGLWHGANWTFVIFGAIHGTVLSAEHCLWPARNKTAGAPRPLLGFLSLWARRILTFNILCLSLAFFRAPTLRAATQFLSGLSQFAWRSEYATALVMLCFFSVPLFIADLLMESSGDEYPFASSPYALRTVFAGAAVVALALFSGNTLNAFAYFRF